MDIQSVNTLSPPPIAQRTATPAANERASTTAAVTEQAPPSTSKAKPSEEQLKTAVSAANEFIKPFNGNLQFSIDKDTGTTVVKVIDIATKEVIKQFPSEEMLSLAKGLDQLTGLLVKQKA
jgi:flagellar protein FlaG